MTYNLIIKSLAEQDIQKNIEWYLEHDEFLAKELLQKIDETFDRIKKNPQHYQKRYNEIRLVFTDKFSYGIYYTIEDTTVYVHAVLHNKQNLETGIKRI